MESLPTEPTQPTEPCTSLISLKGSLPFLVSVFLLAVAIYVSHALLFSPTVGLNAGDEVEYHLLAKNLAAGKGLTYDGTEPTSFRPPLLPGLLAGVYAIFGSSYLPGRVTVALIGATLPLLLFYLTVIYLNDLKCARIAALLALGYYPFVRFSGQLMSDVPFVVLALSFLCCFGLMLRAKNRSIKLPILAGVLLGLCLLCRPTALLLPLWLLLLVVHMANRKLFLRNLAVIVLLAGATIAPWTIRNFFVHRQFVPVSTQGGYAFWQCHNQLPPDGLVGTNPAIQQNVKRTIPPLLKRVRQGEPAEELFQEILSWRGKAYINWLGDQGLELQQEFKNLSEVQTDRLLFAKAFAAIKAYPSRLVRQVIKGAVKFWEPYSDPIFGTTLRRYSLTYGCVLMLAIIGLIHLYQQKKLPWPLILFVINFNFLVAIFYYEQRYRIPAEACLLVFAAAGLTKLATFRKTLGITIVVLIIAANIAIALWGQPAATAIRNLIRNL